MPHEPRKNTGEIKVEVLGPHAVTCESIGDKVVEARLGAEKIQRGPVAISTDLVLSSSCPRPFLAAFCGPAQWSEATSGTRMATRCA